ncbi:MAG: hypothetical protein HC929_20410 [Leptolyngbyaceae cyanobacterium SM2_5_2]|nr:hypothetical protein [Leptolyngbyaceae cyanobacterium SM2_5_2]
MNLKQLELELELEELFEDAAESPEMADLQALWQKLEPVLTALSARERLRMGSQVIDQLAAIHQAKAHCLLDDWESKHNPQEPVLLGNWLKSLVRQSQEVDLSELTAPAQRFSRKSASKDKPAEDTLVGEVPKENLLKMLDQVELDEQKATALAVAHEENIQAWVAELAQWFERYPDPIPLLQLRQSLGWPLVQLWLSLLLGGFKLETTDQYFYSTHVLVSLGSS